MNIENKIKKLFITRPMLLSFILSIILDLITIFILLNFYKQSIILYLITICILLYKLDKQSISFSYENIWFIVSIIICFILIFMYYYFFRKIIKEEFKKSSINSYIKVSKKRFSNYIWGSFLTLFKLIPQGFIINFTTKNNIFIYFVLWIVIAYIFINNILFLLLPIPPIITFITLLTHIILFSSIGINKGIINWVFISIVLVTCINGLIDKNIKVVSFNDRTKNHLDNEFKDSILKLKYKFLLFIPFFYLSLHLSERIIYSGTISEWVCRKYSVNINNISFFSEVNFLFVIIKIIIFLFSMIAYIEYKDFLLNFIFRCIIKLTKQKIVTNNGIYIKIYIKDKKKWTANNYNFFAMVDNKFLYIDTERNEKIKYILKGGLLKFKEKDEYYKKIKFVTDDILLIGNDYYINKCSKIFEEISGADKLKGNILLKKVAYIPMLILLLLLLLCILL